MAPKTHRTESKKIQLTFKPMDKHESGEDKKTEVEEPKLANSSDVIPDSPGRARHVPSLKILNLVKELKKIS